MVSKRNSKFFPVLFTSSMLLTGASTAFADVDSAEMQDAKDKVEASEKSASKYMSNTWLEAKLATTYALNSNLSVFDIETEVRDGTAYISGLVSSEVEKELAEEVAKSVEGIKDVENSIAVEKTSMKKMASKERSFRDKIADLSTTATVKTKLLAESEVAGLDIDVDTKAGEVTLTGTASSEAEKDLAGTLAKNTDGVLSVENDITVKPAKQS